MVKKITKEKKRKQQQKETETTVKYKSLLKIYNYRTSEIPTIIDFDEVIQ